MYSGLILLFQFRIWTQVQQKAKQLNLSQAILWVLQFPSHVIQDTLGWTHPQVLVQIP